MDQRSFTCTDQLDGSTSGCRISQLHVCYASYHTWITQTTPGGIAFHREMIFNIPIIADLHLLQDKRQQLIDDQLI
jgi:hypothetical protein